MTTSPSLKTALATSRSLIEQFLSSLDISTATTTQSSSHPSPLRLLSAAATSLKSNTTRLSLLAITAPFTPSAVVATLQPLNHSILPSLVTATLLTTPALYPVSFSTECTLLTRRAIKDLQQLLDLIKLRSENAESKDDIGNKQKQQFTETTGKVWEDCDLLIRFAKDDVGGFVAKKAKQWLDLMKDAVKEFEDWDPEEDDIEDQDWLGLDEEGSGEEDNNLGRKEEEKLRGAITDRATISAGVKDQVLKVLSRIPQSVHVVIKQRLEKFPHTQPLSSSEDVVEISAAHRRVLELVLKKTRAISECIDESAEAMYLGDPELCMKKAGKARALTIRIVEAVLSPWIKQDSETKEDQYVQKALTWIQQVNTGKELGADVG